MSSPSTSVHHMVNTLRARHARVPSEVGAYLVLETCEKLQRRPSAVSAEHVCVGDAGEVAVHSEARPCDEREAAAALCRLLSFLLVASEDNISPGLLEILEADPSVWTLGRLRDALEANLVPLNRQASRRVLSRLVRESQRPGPRGDVGSDIAMPVMSLPSFGSSDVDASLDAFLSEQDLGDPELDLPGLDPADLDEPALQLDWEPSPSPRRDFPEESAPASQQSSIFRDRQSYFEGLDESESNKSVWLWVGMGALVVVGLVAASTLI